MTDARDVPRTVGHGAAPRRRLAGRRRPADPHRYHRQHGDGRAAVVVRGAEGVRGEGGNPIGRSQIGLKQTGSQLICGDGRVPISQRQFQVLACKVILGAGENGMASDLGAKQDLDGFDPLTENFDTSGAEKAIFEDATRRIVLNILKSYTNYFDCFSELVQNSLDAIDVRVKNGDPRPGKIHIIISMPENIIRIVDNGVGMDERELRCCFRPSVSFKSRKESRGHKGVGATFLAYGFASISVSTKKLNGKSLAVRLVGGRSWCEDVAGTHSRPKLAAFSFACAELANEPSGTEVLIQVGSGNRPDLSWWQASSAKQWLEMLKMRTPLGGVYLAGQAPPKTSVKITVTDQAGETSTYESNSVEYQWPHEIGGSILPKVKTVKDAQDHIAKSEGDAGRISAEFKNLSALWDVWSSDDLLNDANPYWSKTFDEAEEKLIRLHQVSVYGCFLSSAKSWTQYQQEELRIRRSPLLLKGGMQIASDFMVQGDLSVIPLTSTIGYQANTHVVIHFRDGNPDMGRKVFQPELKSLAEKISRQSVNVFKKYLHLMREDSGAPSSGDSNQLFEWRVKQLEYAKESPFEFVVDDHKVAYSTSPRSEQDVIALFHELVGMGVFPGIEFLGTSQNDRYDSCFRTKYAGESKFAFSKVDRPLGVGSNHIGSKLSQPLVLEFKYDLDGLVWDIEKEVKFDADINLVVCWEIGDAYKARYRISSLLVGEEGSTRQYYGSTHAFSYERQKRFEIIALGVSPIYDPSVGRVSAA